VTSQLDKRNLSSSTPHEKLLGIRRVSNLSTIIDPGSLKIDFLVLIQKDPFCLVQWYKFVPPTKFGTGVETPSSRSFWCGVGPFFVNDATQLARQVQ